MVGVVESIVFLVAMNIAAMRDLGVKTSTLRLSGGVAASESLCQKLADLTHCRIARPQETESTLLGVARLLAASHHQSKSAFEINSAERFAFKPRLNPQLQERYRAFKRLMTEKLG